MPAPSQRDRLAVVLVSPRNPLNVGAVARAMVNFGFAQLTVVAPYEPHWREAKSAVGAQALLKNSRCTDRLAEAVADCTLVVGTASLARRTPEQEAIALPCLAPRVAQELARGGRVALVFGPEKRGLTRNDLSLCHLLVEIPTDARQPSMNLGQAAAVCLYELATRLSGSGAGLGADLGAHPRADRGAPGLDFDTREGAMPASRRASSAQLELLAGVMEQAMEAVDYSPAAMRAANRHDLRLLLRRLALTEGDARRTLGLFRKILRRIRP